MRALNTQELQYVNGGINYSGMAGVMGVLEKLEQCRRTRLCSGD